MTSFTLPAELLTLIQHVELNRAGWHNVAVERLILGIIWLADSPLTANQISQSLNSELKISVGRSRLRSHLRELSTKGVLTSLDSNRYAISQSQLSDFEMQLEEVEEVTEHAREKVAEWVSDLNIGIDAHVVWTKLNQMFLPEVFRSQGASTYRLLAGEAIVSPPRLDSFLGEFPDEYHADLTTLVSMFFDGKDRHLREFILRSLNAYFLIEATALRKETLTAIASAERPEFDIFFDTNFLFSILDLHDNPSNDAAKSLLALVSKISEYAAVVPSVLPITLEEARRALHGARQGFGDQPIPPNLAQAAIDTDTMSGLSRSFLQSINSSQQPTHPEEHFGHYARNLGSLLTGKGITFLEIDLSNLMNDPDIRYEIGQQAEYELETQGERAKDYSQLEHDIVLWRFMKEKRPAVADSPADVKYWILTVDYRYLRYDAHKRRRSAYSIPLCVHPTNFIHLLNFWVPRNDDFEEALISSLQLPFLFQKFDVDAERMTQQILRSTSRFEDAKDIPVDTARSILMNDALRQRIRDGADSVEQIETVQRLVTKEHTQAIQDLEEARIQRETSEYELTESRSLMNALKIELKEKDQTIRNLQDRMGLLNEDVRELQGQIADESRRRDRNRKLARFISVGIIGGSTISILLGILSAYVLASAFSISHIRIQLASLAVGLLCWILILSRVGESIDLVRDSKLFDIFKSIRGWLVGGLLLDLGANALWDWLAKLP
jgi:predicted transcriptional regulator